MLIAYEGGRIKGRWLMGHGRWATLETMRHGAISKFWDIVVCPFVCVAVCVCKYKMGYQNFGLSHARQKLSELVRIRVLNISSSLWNHQGGKVVRCMLEFINFPNDGTRTISHLHKILSQSVTAARAAANPYNARNSVSPSLFVEWLSLEEPMRNSKHS